MMAGFYGDIDIRSLSNVIQHADNEELEAILNESSSERINSMIKDLPQVKALESERERMIQANKKSAESNLSFESTYRLSRETLTKNLSECQELKNQLEKKKSQIRESLDCNTPDTILALMQAAMAEAEEASEEVANKFLTKQIPMEEFLKNFIEKRKLYHLRRIKSEKMPEEISRINNSALHPIRPAPPPPSLSFSHLSMGANMDGNNPPYPTTNPFSSFISYPPNPSFGGNY